MLENIIKEEREKVESILEEGDFIIPFTLKKEDLGLRYFALCDIRFSNKNTNTGYFRGILRFNTRHLEQSSLESIRTTVAHELLHLVNACIGKSHSGKWLEYAAAYNRRFDGKISVKTLEKLS